MKKRAIEKWDCTHFGHFKVVSRHSDHTGLMSQLETIVAKVGHGIAKESYKARSCMFRRLRKRV